MKNYSQFIQKKNSEEFKKDLEDKLQKHKEEQSSKQQETEDIKNTKPDDASDKIDQLKNTTDLIEDQGNKIDVSTKEIKKDIQSGKDSEELKPKIDELEKDMDDFDEIIKTAKEESEELEKDTE